MARTRSTKGTAPTAEAAKAASTISRHTLPPESENPFKVFILPTKATTDARVVSLPNPRYSRPTRYLVCPKTGIYEFTKVAAPKATPRSWLITSGQDDSAAADAAATGEEPTVPRADVTKSTDLYIASQIDPVFLVLPSLAAAQSSQKSSSEPAKRMFLSSEDHFDRLAQEDSHLSEVLRWKGTRKLLEERMSAVCDTVEAGDEAMFRLNEKKLLGLVLAKAQRVALPKSMGDKFVRRALEAPVMGIRTTNAAGATTTTQTTTTSKPPKEDGGESQSQPRSAEASDSQSSVSSTDTAATAVSDASTAATSVGDDTGGGETGEVVAAAMQAPEEIVRLQQLRVAFNFICSSYMPPSLTTVLKELLAEGVGADSSFGVDFAPLDDYLARLSKLRQEAAATRSAIDYTKKRTHDEEDEVRAEKRRKKEEEDKRKKAGESRGVRELKKVNVSGMKKLSEFFKKK